MTRAVVVAIALMVAGACARKGESGGDVETEVVLRPSQSLTAPCDVSEKEDVRAKKGKKVTWRVTSGCPSPHDLVTLGNFRTSEGSSADNCRAATEGGAVWPFREDEELARRQGRGTIVLHVKDRSSLPAGTLTYFFDVCTGASAEHKSDPRLMIEE